VGYLVHLTIVCAIYAMAVWSLDLIVGRLRIFSLFHAALLGVGAYGYALGITRFDLSAWPALVIATIGALVAGTLSSFAIRRLRNEQAMIFTLALQGVLAALALNLEVTRGPYGIGGLTLPSVGQADASLQNTAVLAVTFMALVAITSWIFDRTAIGRMARAVGGDETLAMAIGINVARIRTAVFGAAGAVAGLAGAMLAGYLTFIDPQSFSLNESVFLLTALLIGGTGTRLGPLLGIVALILVPEALRFVSVPSTMTGHVQRMLFAVLLIAMVRFRPQGLAGEAIL
jgi:branched-chain amino acid transport system permease protein